jgi:phosphatidylglycerophosphatase GEP4
MSKRVFSVTANGGKLNRFSLRQSFNFPAIRNLLTLFKQPSLILPHISLNNLSELDVERLKAKGIKYIVFDKDNTLTRAFEDELHPDILKTFNKISHHFPGNVAILSNSVGSSDDTDYAEAGMSLLSLTPCCS